MSTLTTQIHKALTTGASTKKLQQLLAKLNAELIQLNAYRVALNLAIEQGQCYKKGDTVKLYGGGLLTENEYLIGTFTIHDMQVTDQGQILFTFAQDGIPVKVEYAYYEKA